MLAVVRSVTLIYEAAKLFHKLGEGGTCNPDHLIMVYYWLTNMNEFRNHDQPNTSLQLKEQFFQTQQNEAANNSNCYSWRDLVNICQFFKKLFVMKIFPLEYGRTLQSRGTVTVEAPEIPHNDLSFPNCCGQCEFTVPFVQKEII